MRVRMLRTVAQGDGYPRLRVGRTADLPISLAQQLIAAKLAVAVSQVMATPTVRPEEQPEVVPEEMPEQEPLQTPEDVAPFTNEGGVSVSYKCEACEESFESRAGLQAHKFSEHRTTR